MKNQSNRLKHKKKIFECFLSIHKSIGNVLISNTNKDKLNQKYEILKQKVASKNYKQILEDKRYQREKRLNSIFHKNNLCISQNTDEFHISNIINYPKSNFVEKYTELYNITINNSKSKKREKNNSVSNLLNNLKNMNYAYNYKQNLKNNLTSKDILLNQKLNDLKNQTFNGQKYITKQNISHQTIYRNYDSNIRNKIFNSKITGVKNVLKSMDKINTESNRNTLLRNYLYNPLNVNNNKNKIRKENYKSYYNNVSKYIKANKDNFIYERNKNSDLRNNLFTANINNNLNLIGNNSKDIRERIVNKVNHFQVRLNLMSMK